MLGCCNREGDTATGNPLSLRFPFNGSHILLFTLAVISSLPLQWRGSFVDEFAAFPNLLVFFCLVGWGFFVWYGLVLFFLFFVVVVCE